MLAAPPRAVDRNTNRHSLLFFLLISLFFVYISILDPVESRRFRSLLFLFPFFIVIFSHRNV